ncbi:MAG: hypothetical protein FWE50_03400 [Alphaproteobacteria bacterium]|nr:hypothetical protein [Alphaproteobacteria bacterium]
MKKTAKFFFGLWVMCSALCVMPQALHADSPIGGPGPSFQNAGGISGNRTTFTGNMGALNNNQWNSMMNPNPKGQGGATADFGNCNSLILRCAQPKCSGCTSMELAIPIVNGCMQSNPSCKQYGDALIESMAAQLVSNANAKANEQMAAASEAAAMQAAAQGAAQMEQMQMQMQQMQMEMAQQSAQSAMAVQAALEEQKQLAAEQAAAAATAQAAAQAAAPEQKVEAAAAMGVSSDVIARQQISGKIMTQMENAEVAMKNLNNTMQNIFDYARCDRNGNNCEGPRRVKAFKNKAGQFFEPYETVLDEIYDALILAQSLGVDITEIYMMLNNSCNVWGKYMCQPCRNSGDSYSVGGITHYCTNGGSGDFYFEVAKECKEGSNCKVSPVQHKCTLLSMITDQETIQQNWLDMEAGSSGGIRIACASDALDNSMLFRNRKKQASITIETLQRMVEQDAPTVIRSQDDAQNALRFCSVDDDDVAKLQVLVQKKALTSTGAGWGKVCVEDKKSQMFARGIYAATIKYLDCETSNPPITDKDCTEKSLDADDCKVAKENRQKNLDACKVRRNNDMNACKDSKGYWNDNICICDEDRGFERNRNSNTCVEKKYESRVSGAQTFRYKGEKECRDYLLPGEKCEWRMPLDEWWRVPI